MDSLAPDRSPGLSAIDFPPFLARAPWWGGDLQTLCNHLPGRRASLAADARLYLPMRDGSGDRLVGSLHRRAAPGASRPLVILIHGLTGTEESHYMVNTASHLL